MPRKKRGKNTTLLASMSAREIGFIGDFVFRNQVILSYSHLSRQGGDWEAVKRCVAVGMGVSVLPSVAGGSELESGALAALGWDGSFEVLTQMAWHEGRWNFPALRAFLEAAGEVFATTSRTSSGQPS